MSMNNKIEIASSNNTNKSDICDIFDASKNNRAPSLAFEKVFEVKYSECYGNNHNLNELKNLALFDILAYEMLTDKQLKEIQKNIQNLKNLSLEDIDSKRNKAIMKNKVYTKPEYALVNYYFLKNNKLNIIYQSNGEYDGFIIKSDDISIDVLINKYKDKINSFIEKNGENSTIPREWTIRVDLLEQILEKENKK